MTLRFGVIGAPIAHSRSPSMHEAAYRALDIDARYERILVESDALAGVIAGLAEEGYAGINVTLPHKEAVIPLLHAVSDGARAIGAVNTITVESSRLFGENTDAEGLVRSLAAAGFDARGARVVVLGAGGAARAAVFGLSAAGAARITVAARRPAAADRLVQSLASATDADLTSMSLSGDLAAAFSDADLVVQATSATLDPIAAARFTDALPFDALPDGAVVTDLVYEPRETKVLAAARKRGLVTVDGVGMLVHQGALAFERWLGRPAPVDVMRAALDRNAR